MTYWKEFASTATACLALCVSAAPLDELTPEPRIAAAPTGSKENLAYVRPAPSVSWARRESAAVLGTNSFTLTKAAADKSAFVNFASDLFPAFTAAEKVRVSFAYRGGPADGKGRLAVVGSMRPMEKEPLFAPTYFERPFPASKDWRDFACEITMPARDFWGVSFGVAFQKGAGKLEVRDIRLEECAPARTGGRRFLVGGEPAAEIAILACDDPLRHLNEFRAARMFRYTLYRNGGEYLPVRVVRDVSEAGPNAVLIGAAAVAAGIFTQAEEDARQGFGERQRFDGGCARRAKGARLGVVGGFPTGPQYGVYRLFRAIGVEYLGAGYWRRPADGDDLAAPADEVFTPVVAFRISHYSNRGGQMPELRGRTTFERLMCDFSPGVPGDARAGVDHSMPRALVSPREFRQSRPDFFAVDEKGETLPASTPIAYTQYCFSNPDLVKLVGERMVELMRANPAALLFPISPGDGGGRYCKCARCRARGGAAAAWLHFCNRVAETTSREFPGKFLHMVSYVDTPEAPASDVRAHPNVTGHYCLYPQRYWPSCLVWEHPANDRGRAALAGWRRIFPRMALVYYPMQCGEWMKVWPSFDMDVAVVRDFARAGAQYTRYFGLAPVHGGDLPQMGAFADLRLHVVGRLEEDPEAEVEPLVAGFMRDFYGPAEKPMRAYFDLLRNEPRRRQWVENCDLLRRRGFVTAELAARALALLDEAEALAAEAEVRRRFLREKQVFLWSYLSDVSIGRGNVSEAETPAWAARVGEFCRIAEETGVTYMGNEGAIHWLHEWTGLAFPENADSSRWTRLPEVQALAKDPVRALKELPAGGQTSTNGGYRVTAAGMTGGQWFQNRRDLPGWPGARTVRRPATGHDTLSALFELKPSETGAARLVVCAHGNYRRADDDVEPIRVELAVNDRTIYVGATPFSTEGMRERAFAIPAGVLRPGRNLVRLRNTTPNETGADVAQTARKNHYRGWVDVESMNLEPGR